ncbi:hypothetical protein RC55_17950 [Herbaspirillum seropedicae]|nr:hypothetical protein [Herbaspirillum seropedicae]
MRRSLHASIGVGVGAGVRLFILRLGRGSAALGWRGIRGGVGGGSAQVGQRSAAPLLAQFSCGEAVAGRSLLGGDRWRRCGDRLRLFVGGIADRALAAVIAQGG